MQLALRQTRDLLLDSSSWQRVRWLTAWLVGLYLAWIYVRQGVAKFDPEGFWTAAFEGWGYPVWFRLGIGVIETVGGVLLLLPWTATYSALAVGVVMVGALVTLIADGQIVYAAWVAGYLAGLLWIAYEWRRVRWPRRR